MGSPLYGVVQFDFKAERSDELEAKAGDPILIIAQSTKEWFVAKPIGRLGGPGLIPVDFIEIRDMATGVPCENKEEAIARAQVPKVEEWKKMTADYKNTSITLNKSPQEQYEETQARMSLSQHQSKQYRQSELTINGSYNGASPYSTLIAAVSATVEKWTYENERYWYILQATMEDGQHRTLCRNYEDFYDLQIALLQEFPEEAGQNSSQKRLLPYMPGPVAYVNASISNARRTSLDEYVKDLLALPAYISRCHLVKKLFILRHGDVEHRSPPSRQTYDSNAPTLGNPDSYYPTSQQRFSQTSGRSSDSSHEHQYNGNGNGNGYAPQRPQHARQQSAQIGQAQQINLSRQNPDLAPPRMLRQDSSLSAMTTGSNSSNSAFIKVKIQYQSELIAVRLPRDVSFVGLQEKLAERLGGEVGVLQLMWRDGEELRELRGERDLAVAISRNSKLVVYAS